MTEFEKLTRDINNLIEEIKAQLKQYGGENTPRINAKRDVLQLALALIRDREGVTPDELKGAMNDMKAASAGLFPRTPKLVARTLVLYDKMKADQRIEAGESAESKTNNESEVNYPEKRFTLN